MFDDNEQNFEEKYLNEIINRYEDNIKLKKNIFFDLEEFSFIIDYYIDKNKLSSADEALKIAIKLYPETVELMLRKAKILIEKNNTKEALNELKAAENIDNSNYEIYMLKGIAYINSRQIKEAEKCYDICISKIFDDERKFEIIFVIGLNLIHIKEFKLAVKYFTLCEKQCSDRPEVLSELAYCHEGLGNYHKSIEYYNRCLDEDPFDNSSWYNLGLVYQRVNEPSLALQALDFALAIDPYDLNAYLAKASLLYSLELFRKAIDAYEEYLVHDKDCIDIHYFIGECYERMEKYDKAAEKYEYVLLVDNKYVDALLGLGYLCLLKNNYYESLEYFYKAEQIAPENPEIHYSLSEALLKTEDYQTAMKHIDRAISYNPGEADYFLLKSELLIAQNLIDKSISELENCVEKLTDKAPVYYRLAGMHLNTDNSGKALRYFKLASEMEPGMIHDFFEIFPEAKDFKGFKGLLNLPE